MRFPLKPLQPKDNRKPERFCVLDIEANDWINFVVEGYYTKEDGGVFEFFDSHEKMIDFMFNKQDIDVAYVHNGGGYDFMFWIKPLLEDENYDVKLLGRGSRLLNLKVSRIVWGPDIPLDTPKSKLVYKRGKIAGYIDRTIEFRDSLALLPMSLDRLGKSFDTEHKKTEFDYNTIEKIDDELLEYLENDCKCLYEVIEKYQSWPLIKRAGTAYTMASQALKVFRTMINRPIPSLSEKVDTFVRQSYFGGRTEVFKPIFMQKSQDEYLSCKDVNSLYPYVMKNNEFPIKPISKVTEYRAEGMGFYHVKVRVPEMYVPPLGTYIEVNKQKKYCFPVGEFWGYWTNIELEYAKTLGVEILECKEGYTFKSGGKIFDKYVSTLYEMKNKGREEGDTCSETICKLLMNSLYGRFGLSTDKEEIFFDDGIFHEESDVVGELATKRGVIRLYRKPKRLEKIFTNVAIASWVTSLSRIHMHKLYMENPYSLYYTDTDSLFTTNEFNTSNELGDLKHEYGCDSACFLLPKFYSIHSVDETFSKIIAEAGRDGILREKNVKTSTKVVGKGFDKLSLSDIDVENLITAFEGSFRLYMKDDLKKLKTLPFIEKKQRRKIATFKTAIRKGNALSMIEEQVKCIRTFYNKREIFKSGRGKYEYDTRPLLVKDNVVQRRDL